MSDLESEQIYDKTKPQDRKKQEIKMPISFCSNKNNYKISNVHNLKSELNNPLNAVMTEEEERDKIIEQLLLKNSISTEKNNGKVNCNTSKTTIKKKAVNNHIELSNVVNISEILLTNQRKDFVNIQKYNQNKKEHTHNQRISSSDNFLNMNTALNFINQNYVENKQPTFNNFGVTNKTINNKLRKETANSSFTNKLESPASEKMQSISALKDKSNHSDIDRKLIVLNISNEIKSNEVNLQNIFKISKNENFLINCSQMSTKKVPYLENNKDMSTNRTILTIQSPNNLNLSSSKRDYLNTDYIKKNNDMIKSRSATRILTTRPHELIKVNSDNKDKVIRSYREDIFILPEHEILDKGKIDFTEYYFIKLKKTCSNWYFLIGRDMEIKLVKFPLEIEKIEYKLEESTILRESYSPSENVTDITQAQLPPCQIVTYNTQAPLCEIINGKNSESVKERYTNDNKDILKESITNHLVQKPEKSSKIMNKEDNHILNEIQREENVTPREEHIIENKPENRRLVSDYKFSSLDSGGYFSTNIKPAWEIKLKNTVKINDFKNNDPQTLMKDIMKKIRLNNIGKSEEHNKRNSVEPNKKDIVFNLPLSHQDASKLKEDNLNMITACFKQSDNETTNIHTDAKFKKSNIDKINKPSNKFKTLLFDLERESDKYIKNNIHRIENPKYNLSDLNINKETFNMTTEIDVLLNKIDVDSVKSNNQSTNKNYSKEITEINNQIEALNKSPIFNKTNNSYLNRKSSAIKSDFKNYDLIKPPNRFSKFERSLNHKL